MPFPISAAPMTSSSTAMTAVLCRVSQAGSRSNGAAIRSLAARCPRTGTATVLAATSVKITIAGGRRGSPAAGESGRLPDVAVPPVAGERGGPVERHGDRKDVHGAVVVGRTPDAVRSERERRAGPRQPATGGVDGRARVRRAQRAEVVPAAHDPLQRGHHRAGVPATALVRPDTDALDKPGRR